MTSRLLPLIPALLLAFPPMLAVRPLHAQEWPSPQAEHQELSRSVGTWDAAITSFDAEGKPAASKGVLVQKLGPGGFWVLEDFTGECMGTRCTGFAALGYDPVRKVFVQSATFSMSPQLALWTGTFDKTGKVLTMTTEVAGANGTVTRMRKVTTWASADEMTIAIRIVLPDGQELTTMTLACTRRAGTGPASSERK